MLNGLFDEYAMFALRERDIAPDTVKEQMLYLDRAAAYLSAETPAGIFSAFTPKRLMDAVTSHAAQRGPGSRRWFQLSLRSFLKFCHLRGYVNADMSCRVPSFHRPRLASVPKAIPDDAIGHLLAGIAPGDPCGRRDAAIIQLLATYGVRGFHVRHLLLSDLDWKANLIHFSACKRGKAIIQHMTVEAGNRLSDYICMERPPLTGRPEVFLGSKPPYRPFRCSASLSGMIARRLRQAGVRLPEGVSRGTHGFRHAFATRLCGKIPYKHISDMLGHRDISSAMVYAKVNFDELATTALPWPEEDAL
jgi:integrase